MQNPAFALTKIEPPRSRAGLIARPKLEAMLAQALATRRIVLLCAAAGYGKTCALTRAIAALPAGHACAWVSLDEDDDLQRLLACLVAALEPFDLPWRVAPDALAAAGLATRAQRAAAADALVNALADSEVPRGAIVLDDLHRVADPTVFDWLDRLIERLPAPWCVVVASRVEPPLALPRWRAADELAEFGDAALRFDHAEAAQLRTLLDGAAGGAAATGDLQIDRLLDRTGGWAAGLRLALRSAPAAPAGPGSPGTDRGGVDRRLFDYLASEVLAEMPPRLRDFLLRCSVLPELGRTQCAAVWGDNDAAQLLAEVERRGLFVTALDERGETLRLHDLFRDFLEDRLRRGHADELPELLVRAAASEPDPVRRIGHLLRAGAWDAAEAALVEAGGDLITRGAAPTVQRLIEQFPAAFRHDAPGLQLVRGLVAWSRWDWDATIAATRRAVDIQAQRGDDAGWRHAQSYLCVALSGAHQFDEAQAQLAALLREPLEDAERCRALHAASWIDLSHGDQRDVAGRWAEVVALLERSDDLQLWYECSPLPPFAALPGMRPLLLRYRDGALRLLPEDPTPLRGMTSVLDGWLRLWAGDVAGALGCAATAAADSRWLGAPVNLNAQRRTLQAMLAALHGDGAAAQALIEEELADVRPSPMRRRVYLGLYQLLAFRFAAMTGDTARQRELGPSLSGIEHDQGWVSPPMRSLVPPQLAFAAGRIDEACRLWTEALDDEHRVDLYGQAFEARLRLAAAHCARGRPGPAAQALRPLFTRVAASGEWGLALAAGGEVLGALTAQPWGRLLTADDLAALRQWAAAAARLRPGGVAPPVRADAAAADPLSEREREVLARIAAGDSNKLIARAFELSPHTVKRHVANILDKLGVQSRGQAAAWWRTHDAPR